MENWNVLTLKGTLSPGLLSPHPSCTQQIGWHHLPLATTTGCTGQEAGAGSGKHYNSGKQDSLTTTWNCQHRKKNLGPLTTGQLRVKERTDMQRPEHWKQSDVWCRLYRVERRVAFIELLKSTLTHTLNPNSEITFSQKRVHFCFVILQSAA